MKFTIITINYNNCKGLKATLESVTSQSFTDFEYLVIDGGSTDGSVDLIRAYEDRITRWTSEPDKGIYDAMNKGLRQTRGEYVNFMNSGDCFSAPDILQQLADAPLPPDTALIYSDTFTEQGDGQRRLWKAHPFWEQQTTEEAFIYGGGICHQSLFVRTDLARQYPFDNSRYKLIADFQQIRNIYKLGYPAYRLNTPIAVFDRTGVSTTRRKEVFKETAHFIGAYHTMAYYRFYWRRFLYSPWRWALRSRLKKLGLLPFQKKHSPRM